MEERLKLSRIYIIACLSMIVIGFVALIVAFTGDPQDSQGLSEQAGLVEMTCGPGPALRGFRAPQDPA